jgi:hypothetical protein
MQITRFLSLSEPQFLGCAAAFVETLFAELTAAAVFLRKLQGLNKGAAFAFEMELDRRRYGALLVLGRWAELNSAFGAHLQLTPAYSGIRDHAASRIETAETLLGHTNRLIDAAAAYTPELIEGAVLGLRSLETTFAQERAVAETQEHLGPLRPPEYLEAKRVFLQDLQER